MHSKEEVLASVSRQLERIAETDAEVRPETNIAEQFALDSVKVLDLLMEIEDEFDVSVPLNLMVDVQTVNDLAEVIYQIVAEK
jgi:acyl carrier protein